MLLRIEIICVNYLAKWLRHRGTQYLLSDNHLAVIVGAMNITVLICLAMNCSALL